MIGPVVLSLAGCQLGLDPLVLGAGVDDSGEEPPYGGDTDISDDTGLDGGTGDEGDGGGSGSGSSGSGSSGSGSGDSGSGDEGDDGGSSDGGGSSSSSSAPTLSDLSTTSSGPDVVVSFVADDADDDIEGGELLLDADGTMLSYMIPDDLESWTQGSTSTAGISVTGMGDCDSSSFSITAQVEDRAGNASSSLSTTASVSGDGVQTTEVADDWTEENIGTVAKGDTLCGNIWTTGNNGSDWTGDVDVMYFQASGSGSWKFTLSWSGTADYDLALFDGAGNLVASDARESNTSPESVQTNITNGSYYYLFVGAWSGATGDWEIATQ
jgi:hypothetical protein